MAGSTCLCGCGQTPPVAPRTRRSRGWVVGQPRPLVPGHKPQAGAATPAKQASDGVRPRVTREALHRSLEPPNNCRVRVFLDVLDGESRDVVEEALAYGPKDYPAPVLRKLLLDCGFPEDEIPGASAIQDHRLGRRPCRCKG